ncbi:endo alpha-1,4 polygalactosaminidase [Brevibacterium atlanticum]|uniref:endo alpha-1,4 polygalactosaminidase n=1 Tax=Brevibacterium atlanticum TaxID=2697563 RepID=UPI001D195A3C|nr:endo alpha-1,4 polygalactosaminidase [Brevibacterium atlanticum]
MATRAMIANTRSAAVALSLISTLVVAGCSGPAETDTSAAHARETARSNGGSTEAITLPPTSGVFDYQLGGAYDELPVDSGQSTTTAGTRIDVVVRDGHVDPLPGAYSVCYVNGFQTQPDEAEDWADDEDVLLHDGDGNLVVDPDWPDEHIFDPSTKHARTIILDRLGEVIDGCADRGYAAVEIDNLDIAQRFDAIDSDGVNALARSYVERAHQAGLAIAQKNSAEITRTAHHELGFDFAVTEECAAFAECDVYTEVYGDHVLGIEYPDSLAEAGLDFSEVCDLSDRAPLAILRDRELVAAGESGHRYEACPSPDRGRPTRGM